MFAAITRVLTSRRAGPVATAVCLLLAAALLVTAGSSARERAALKAQVADLQRSVQTAKMRAQALEVSCRSERGGENALLPVAASTNPEQAAEQLAAAPPAGFDVCARMESADEAVLATLK